jgi:HPt (histidine-containing phosphotransfer) domain-containing protein
MSTPSRSLPGLLDAKSLERLRALEAGGACSLLDRVLATFSSSGARLLAQVRAARDAGDVRALRLAVHTLRSSSASIGALALSRLCAEVETRLGDETIASLRGRLDDLDGEGQRVLEALDAGAAT